MAKTTGVYLIISPSNGKSYVGSTVDLYGRLQSHRRNLEKGDHPNSHLQRSYNKDPNLLVVPIPMKDREEAYDAEQDLLDHYLPKGELLNMMTNARIKNRGKIPDEETRRKMSEWQIGKKHSPETLAKLKERAAGRIPTEAARIAASAKTKGVPKEADVIERARMGRSAHFKEVHAEGVKYECLSAAARAHGITPATAHHRINHETKFLDWFYV